MKFSRFILLAAAICSALPAARASISINTQFAQLFQADGTTGIGAGKIGILVADEGLTPGIVDPYNTVLNVGNFLGGTSDDLIIGLITSTANVSMTGASGLQDNLTGITYSGNFAAGDKLYVLWFPTIATVGATVDSGVSYGVYRSDTVNSASGSNIAFFAPADGSTVTLAVYLDSIASGSGVTVADFTASQVTAVPEPSIYGLMGVGAVGLILFRARNRRRG